MPTITYPTNNVLHYNVKDVYIAGDDTSVAQYLIDNGLPTGTTSYVLEDQRFSNDGGIAYQYYEYDANLSGNTWKTEFGYRRIVTSVTYS